MSFETLISLVVFVAVLIFSAVILQAIFRKREVEARVADTISDTSDDGFHIRDVGLDADDTEENRLIRRYFEITRRDNNPNSTQNRLIRAGYFGQRSVIIFQALRGLACLIVMVMTITLIERYYAGATRLLSLIAGMLAAGVTFIVVNIYVERQGDAKEREYRRLFPDFMDMMIVCLDAGMSLEAAANRVAREFVAKKKDFGLHLSIMMLEVRGGRRLRDALANLSQRLRIDEARALAVLFRQSEELGTSVTQALRVYSQEMREMRIIRAEEKANALPIKMLLPLGAFLFPVSLIIVLVPIVMRVMSLLIGLTPG